MGEWLKKTTGQLPDKILSTHMNDYEEFLITLKMLITVTEKVKSICHIYIYAHYDYDLLIKNKR